MPTARTRTPATATTRRPSRRRRTPRQPFDVDAYRQELQVAYAQWRAQTPAQRRAELTRLVSQLPMRQTPSRSLTSSAS